MTKYDSCHYTAAAKHGDLAHTDLHAEPTEVRQLLQGELVVYMALSEYSFHTLILPRLLT